MGEWSQFSKDGKNILSGSALMIRSFLTKSRWWARRLSRREKSLVLLPMRFIKSLPLAMNPPLVSPCMAIRNRDRGLFSTRQNTLQNPSKCNHNPSLALPLQRRGNKISNFPPLQGGIKGGFETYVYTVVGICV